MDANTSSAAAGSSATRSSAPNLPSPHHIRSASAGTLGAGDLQNPQSSTSMRSSRSAIHSNTPNPLAQHLHATPPFVSAPFQNGAPWPRWCRCRRALCLQLRRCKPANADPRRFVAAGPDGVDGSKHQQFYFATGCGLFHTLHMELPSGHTAGQEKIGSRTEDRPRPIGTSTGFGRTARGKPPARAGRVVVAQAF